MCEMTVIEIPCADGGDRHCFGTVEMQVPVALEAEEINELKDGFSIPISPDRFKALGIDASLYKEDLEDLENLDDIVEIQMRAEELELDFYIVCGACGSDQDYDDDGNNVTGR